jgi:hypothetical protein
MPRRLEFTHYRRKAGILQIQTALLTKINEFTMAYEKVSCQLVLVDW